VDTRVTQLLRRPVLVVSEVCAGGCDPRRIENESTSSRGRALGRSKSRAAVGVEEAEQMSVAITSCRTQMSTEFDQYSLLNRFPLLFV
jgi:hypothetical protein